MTSTVPLDEAPLRVLVVDDCRDNADSLALVLKQWAFDCRAAYHAEAACAMALTFKPDVVVADIAMPSTTGLELATQLRVLDAGPHALIALSGYSDAERRLAAAQAGFDFYLVKPPDLSELRHLLDGTRRVAAYCQRIAQLADRAELLTSESRRLIDTIRAELRAGRSNA